jgi:hypothetical protein
MIRLARLAVVVGALAAAGACGDKNKKGADDPDGFTNSNQANMPKVDPALCDTSGKNVQTFDLNQDGRADVWKIYAQEEEDGTKLDVLTCKQVDYDKDGTKDYVVVYNRQGEMVVEEIDLGLDGTFDAREHYDKKTGTIYMVERDIDHNKNTDTWEKYDSGGQLESIERDRNGDGKPDLWEQYKAGTLLAILYDDDYDRKVDRKEQAMDVRLPAAQPPPPSGTGSAPPAADEPVDTVEGDVAKPAEEAKPAAPAPAPAPKNK